MQQGPKESSYIEPLVFQDDSPPTILIVKETAYNFIELAPGSDVQEPDSIPRQASSLWNAEEANLADESGNTEPTPSLANNYTRWAGNMSNRSGGATFGTNGGRIEIPGPLGVAFGLGALLAQGIRGGDTGEETRRRRAAEEEAARAKRELEKQQRQAEAAAKLAEEADKRAAECEQAEKDERAARNEACEAAAQALRAEEQERQRREEADKKLGEERLFRELGVELDYDISEEERRSAKLAVNYVENCTNIAVVGRQNAGKSTLVNCLRGVKHGAPGSARVSEAETTRESTAYKDEKHEGVVWHDVPGGGTAKISAWGYYYNQKLFAYDKILLAHFATLTELDIRVLQVCTLMKQECIVARTQADIHIRNCKRRNGHTSVEAAREDYVRQVQEDTMAKNAQTGDVELLRLDFIDYIICEMGVAQLVNGEPQSSDPAEQAVDEERFLRRLELWP